MNVPRTSDAIGSLVRERLREFVRGVHERFCTRELPRRIAVCLHELPESRFASFRAMVTYFRDCGYRFVDPLELMRSREERAIMISFDDNYRSWHRALPLMDELDVRVTFYVQTGPFEADETPSGAGRAAPGGRSRTNGESRPDPPLRPDELRELREAGHIVGAHAHTHRSLTRLPERAARREIAGSKHILQEILDEPILHFSYPFGTPRHFDDPLRAYCRELGFATVANATAGLLHDTWRPFDLSRTVWYLDRSLRHNLTNLAIDGRPFVRLTGRCPVW